MQRLRINGAIQLLLHTPPYKAHKQQRNLRTALFRAITRRIAVITYGRFGTNCRSYYQASIIQQYKFYRQREVVPQYFLFLLSFLHHLLWARILFSHFPIPRQFVALHTSTPTIQVHLPTTACSHPALPTGRRRSVIPKITVSRLAKIFCTLHALCSLPFTQ